MARTVSTFSPEKIIIKSVAGILLLLSSLSLSGQTHPDFSGVWVQDNDKSDFYKGFNVTCAISQTSQSINVKTTISDKDNTESVIRESTFTLDGKETTDSEGAKKSAKWSPDNKILTTSDTKDYGGDLVGVTAFYSLSVNGLVLTVKSSDINPMAKSITQVFNKNK